MFKFGDVIKCLNIKKEYILLNNLGSKHSLNEIWLVYILQKKKFCRKILASYLY